MTLFGYERTLEALAILFLLALYVRLLVVGYRAGRGVPEDPAWCEADRRALAEIGVTLP